MAVSVSKLASQFVIATLVPTTFPNFRSCRRFEITSQPSFFNDENWPLILAFRVAGKLGKSGRSNESGKPNTSSVSDGRKAAEQGDVGAQLILGLMYARSS